MDGANSTRKADEVDSEDEWYARMEAAAAGSDDEQDVPAPTQKTAEVTESVAISDEEYYNNIQDHNCNVVNEAFSSEVDPIWHSLLKTAAKSTSSQTPKGQLLLVKPADFASITLAQQWAFGYLPRSAKMYMELGLYSSSTDEFLTMYTDDLLHPTLVAMIALKHSIDRIEVSAFSPYTASETAFPALFNTIEAVRASSGLTQLMFCGVDTVHYEQCLSKHPHWKPTWLEVYGAHVFESHTPPEVDVLKNPHYVVADLRERDADTINDTWKYKTAASILLVKKMIAMGMCRGIRYMPNVASGAANSVSTETTFAGGTDNSELVSWFLQYPDGSMGMLYTTPAHRSKGLARIVVKSALHKVLANQETRKCAPYVFIEVSNEASRALFVSLGFTRKHDAVWAILKYQSNEC